MCRFTDTVLFENYAVTLYDYLIKQVLLDNLKLSHIIKEYVSKKFPVSVWNTREDWSFNFYLNFLRGLQYNKESVNSYFSLR